jgi:Tfp pilus assembly protein PilN
MIKINLLPVKEAKRRKQVILVVYFGALATVVLLLMGWFWYLQVRTVHDLNARIAKVDEESKGYEEKIKEVKDLQLKEKSLESYRGVIKSIYDEQKKVLGAIDQLAMTLPAEVWLTAIEQGRGDHEDELIVTGSSLKHSAVQEYVAGMTKPGGFLKDPLVDDLLINQVVTGTSTKVYKFVIKVKMGSPL